MGIKGLTKLFSVQRVLKEGDIKNTAIAIDAMNIIYRCSLGMKSTHSLTDKNGSSTVHLNTLFSVIIKFIQYKIKQVWVFDCPKQGEVPLKIEEIKKRRQRKEEAERLKKELQAQLSLKESTSAEKDRDVDYPFSDGEEQDLTETVKSDLPVSGKPDLLETGKPAVSAKPKPKEPSIAELTEAIQKKECQHHFINGKNKPGFRVEDP